MTMSLMQEAAVGPEVFDRMGVDEQGFKAKAKTGDEVCCVNHLCQTDCRFLTLKPEGLASLHKSIRHLGVLAIKG